MKKTTTINLAGMVYHIEEDAFQILKDYLTDIKRVFSSQEGVEEMVADIESRIAELFQERLNKNKEVVTYTDVEEVISIMGSPNQFDEDYDEAEYEENKSETQFNQKAESKRLYRDTDEGMLAGVSAGLGHYLNIDPVLIRVLWIVLVLVGGSGVLVYIIAWIAIPEAKTTAQKLQMKGQPANLDNIKAFADSVKEEAKTGFKRASNSVKFTIEKGNGAITTVLRMISRLIGFVLIIGGIVSIVALVLVFITKSNFVFVNGIPVFTDVKTGVGLIFEDATLAVWSIFFVALIPIMFLIMLGEMLTLSGKKKSRAFILTLLVIWFAAIVTISVLGAKTGFDFKERYTSVERQIVQVDSLDLQVNLFEDDLKISNEMEYSFNNYLSIDEEEIKMGYARIEVLSTPDSIFYYTVERRSQGGTLKSAKINSEDVRYAIAQDGNVLNIPTRYSFPKSSKFRGQKVTVKIFVPQGKQIVLNGNLENYPLKVHTRTHFSDDFIEQSSTWKATDLGMEFKGFLD